MRTLKKVLALTVVLATLLSISAFAAFSDEESINENFVDAVNLLGALNVMTGDTEGTFRPTDTISRAEAAKMIYVIRNGGVDDQAAGWTGMSTFSDVTPGVWYEGYVNYCASLNIIAGIGGGLFNPSGAVTGVELAKMMLVVADYRPDIEKYTGTGWNLNVIRDAQSAGMFKGYTLAYSAAATREQAAQLFANAILETEMAVYIGDVRVNNAAMLGEAETVGGRFFDLAIQTGVLTKVPHVSLPLKIDGSNPDTDNRADVVLDNKVSGLNANDKVATIEAFNDSEHLYWFTNNGANTQASSIDFEFEADPDLLYQEVTVIYQENNEGGILDRKSKVYAVLPTGDSDVYETTMDAITIELDDDAKKINTTKTSEDYNPATIQFEGYNGNRAKALENDLPVVTNLYEGAAFDFDAASYVPDYDKKLNLVNETEANKIATTSTAPIRLIDIDGNGVLDVAFVTTPYYGTVSSYNADRYEFTTDATIDGDDISTLRRQENFENFTFEDEIEKDDVIAVTIDVTSGEMLYNVSLVEPTTGALTYVYSTGADNEVVIGGETYGFYGWNFNGKLLTAITPKLNAEAYVGDLGDEVTVYTDGKYIITAEVEPATLGSGFAFVKNYNLEGNSFDLMPTDSQALLIELVLPDGSTVVKEYDREEVTSSTTGWYEAKDLVTLDRTATALLKEMVGNIVEYSADGNYVAFRSVHKSDSLSSPEKAELDPQYHDVDGVTYTYNPDTNVFRASSNRGLDVNANTVLFLPTYKDDTLKDCDVAGNISKVTVIKGDALHGMPTITTEDNTTDLIMQLVSCKQSGISTVAYAALDAGSTVSETGLYFYALQNDWDQDIEEGDGRYALGVLSDSDSDEGAIIEINSGDDVIANKVYRATRNSDGTYDLEEIDEGVAPSKNDPAMNLGYITGRNGNNVNIGDDVFHFDADKTVVFVVDIDAKGSMTRINLGDVSDLDEAAKWDDDDDDATADVYYNNVLFEADKENGLTVVYVEAVGMDVEPLISYRTTSGMTIEQPVLSVGMDKDAADAAVKAAMPANVNVDSITWAPAISGTVNSGSTYTATVKVSPRAGHTFENDANDDFIVKITNGTDDSSVVAADGTVTFDITGITVGKTQITSANVTTPLVLPTIADGSAPSTTLTAGAIDNATISTITWFGFAGSTAAAGETYEGVFTVTADADFAFAADFDLGLPENATVTANADNTVLTVRVTGTVPAPAATEIEGPIEITVAAPVNGQVLPATGTLSNTTVTVAWSDTGNAVFGDDDLVATLTVKANANYVFGTMTTADVTLSGAGYTVTNVVANGANDTLIVTATATVQPATLAKTTTISLTDVSTATTTLPATATVSAPAAGVEASAAVTWTGDANDDGQSTATESLVATLTVTASEGYVFDDTIATSDVTISGYTVESVDVSEDGLTLTIVLEAVSVS